MDNQFNFNQYKFKNDLDTPKYEINSDDIPDQITFHIRAHQISNFWYCQQPKLKARFNESVVDDKSIEYARFQPEDIDKFQSIHFDK